MESAVRPRNQTWKPATEEQFAKRKDACPLFSPFDSIKQGSFTGLKLINTRRLLCPFLLMFVLAPSVLSFGYTTEVEKMAQDRPQVLQVISPGDDMWTWLEKHFQNTNGVSARWSNEQSGLWPQYIASHCFDKNGTAVIMIAGRRPDGSLIGGEEFLSMVVFELLNASHRDEFTKLNNLVVEKSIDCSVEKLGECDSTLTIKGIGQHLEGGFFEKIGGLAGQES